MNIFATLSGSVVVSAQVMDPLSPLADAETLADLALAAGIGGAAGFRVDGADVVAVLRARTDKPIIGIAKQLVDGFDNYITPSVILALGLIDEGCDVVAVQATAGTRPAESFAEIVAACHARGVQVMADISTLDEALAAARSGADAVATTMVGFTRHTLGAARPQLDLVRTLKRRLSVPVVVEGGIWGPDDVRESFEAGADVVVIGSAVTAPDIITARFVAASPQGARSDSLLAQTVHELSS